MKASKLIEQLGKLIERDGDLEVRFLDMDKMNNHSLIEDVEIAGISVLCDDNDKPVKFTICDDATLDAFVE